jgi:hypothetical protein
MKALFSTLFRARTAAPATSKGSGTSSGSGGGALPPPDTANVKPKQVSIPSHMTATTASTAKLSKNDLNLANRDITQTYRFGASTSDTLRALVRANPDMGAALSGHLRMGIPERYILPTYNRDGSFNVEATAVAMELAQRYDKMPDPTLGFCTTGSLRSIAEGVAKDGLIEGAMCAELVLDRSRLPTQIAPVSAKTIKFYDDWSGGVKSLRPVQEMGGQEIDLDIPNFFMVWLDPSLIDAYPHPPMESAIQPVLGSSTFLGDLRRLCERHVYPRYVSTIDEEKLRKHLDQETLGDPAKLAAKLNEVIAAVQDALSNLEVEDAIVVFDSITVEYVKNNTGDVPNTFETVQGLLNSKIATGTRSTPTILGHSQGSQNIASTETLISMMTANSMVRLKLQELFSKLFTLALRLMGYDVTVSFEYDDIDLRPASELEAFRSLKQDRILRLVSLGYMTDEEACLRLTGRLPPKGFTVRWDTMFMDPKSGADPNGNSYSGTGAGGGQSGGGASTQSRKPGTPQQNRGS